MNIVIPDNNLLKRGFLFLEDGEWARADEYFEKLLDENMEFAEAYLGKLMAEFKLKKIEDFESCPADFTKSNNYDKVMRFGNQNMRAQLNLYAKNIGYNAEIARKETILNNVKNSMQNSSKWLEEDYDRAISLLKTIQSYKNAEDLITLLSNQKRELHEKREIAKKENILSSVVNSLAKSDKWEAEEFDHAIEALNGIRDFKNAEEIIALCEEKKLQAEAVRTEKKKKRAKKIKMISVLSVILVVLAVSGYFAVTKIVIPTMDYNTAVEYMNNQEYGKAVDVFKKLGDFKDSKEKIKEAQYLQATELMNSGKCFEAVEMFRELGNYKDSKEKIKEILIGYGNCSVISTDYRHTVGLKSVGTVVAVGDNDYGQCDVSDWNDIVAVSAGRSYTVGLKSDGTVVTVGYNYDGQCNVSDWKDIVAISAGFAHTVGLKSDGTVVGVGLNYSGQCDVLEWTDIVAVSAGSYHTVGLKSDGTVVAVGWNEYVQCNVSGWKDIVAVSADSHTVGLKSDGTVVAVGRNDDGQCDVSDWKDIVAVSAGSRHTVGLKSDGTVVAVGNNGNGGCNVSDWKDIVAVYAGGEHTVGLKSDGTVVAVGINYYGQRNVSGWTDIMMPKIK